MIAPRIFGCATIINFFFTICVAEEASLNLNPTQVAVRRHFLTHSQHSKPDIICGGTIISVRHVLTSSHCLVDFGKFGHSARELSVLYACTRLSSCANRLYVTEVWWRRKYFTSSEGWTHYGITDTLAVLKLQDDIPSSAGLKLAQVLRTSVLDEGKIFLYSGWGIDVNGNDNDRSLSRINVKTINNTECEQLKLTAITNSNENMDLETLTDNKFCTKAFSEDWNCKHAIGGGLVNGTTLYGVHSSCIGDNGSIIFISPDRFYNWINHILNDFSHETASGKYEDSYFHY